MDAFLVTSLLALATMVKVVSKFRLYAGGVLLAFIAWSAFFNLSLSETVGSLVLYLLLPFWLGMIFMVTIGKKIPPLAKFLDSLEYKGVSNTVASENSKANSNLPNNETQDPSVTDIQESSGAKQQDL